MKKPSPSARPGNGNSLRDLYAPIIPNMAPPFEDYQGGIGAALVEGGLKCIVDPWEPMENGDAIGFYWGNEQAPVWTDVIDGNANERLFFTISKGFIVRGDADPVFYRVTIPGQTPEDSRRLRLFVKLDRPGGYDDNPSIPGHSGLLYVVPQEIIDNGVGPIEADAGVDITILHYEFMRKNDRIRLAWGRVIVEHTVQPDEVDTDIPIHVDKATIEAADDGDITIAYQVVDVCNNYPDERSPWSAITTVQVDVGGNRLDAPQVLVNGFPAPQNVIDLEQLAGADVICRVYTNQTDHAIDDILQLTWVGTPAQGDSSVIVGPLEQTVQFIPFQYDFPIPYEYVEAIAKGRASVSYVRIRSGVEDRPSKNANVTVVGDITLPERPSFVEAGGSVLDPNLNFYTISVPYYPGRQPGDHLYIVFEGLDASNNPTGFDINAYVSNEPNGAPILRDVDKNEIKRLDGGSLTVYYWINSQRKSQELVLSVGSGQPSMPKPNVIRADSNDVLNPDDVNPITGADVVVPYTGTLPNDIVGLRWRGSLSSAPDQETPPLNPGSAGNPIPFVVPFQYVIGNLNGTVDTDYYIIRTGSPIQRSLIRELTIGSALELLAPSVKQATGNAPSQQLNPVAAKDELTVEIPDYGAQPGDQVSVTWAGTPGGGSYTSPLQALPGSREILLPVSVIAYNLDRSVTVTYTVTPSGGNESPPSGSLILAVQTIAQDDLLVAKPRILQAANNGEGPTLDVSNLTGDATVRIDSWPLIAQGQRIWLRLEGTKDDGSRYEKLWSGANNWVSADWYRQGYGEKGVLGSELQTLRDGSTLKVEFKASFDQSIDEAHADTFPPRTYTIQVTLVAPTIDSALDEEENLIPDGGETMSPLVTLIGRAAPLARVDIFDFNGPNPIETAQVEGSGAWKAPLRLSVASHSLTARGRYGNNPISAAYTLDVVASITENFDLQPDRIISAGQSFDIPTMRVTLLSGPIYAGIFRVPESSSTPGKVEGQALLMHTHRDSTDQAGQRLRLDLKSTCSRVSFWYSYLNYPDTNVYYYDANSKLLGTKTLVYTKPSDVHQLEFAATGIRRIEVQTQRYDLFYMDNFVFTR
ncbi:MULTISPECIES: hypothetical protein [unclassified Pseudomonas]|uniref:hypothetical protein n=1 Tax=unclassified Pseudomonas TaxID=196821 RepID=UPI000C2FA811|nr:MULTISPECIES: hypothetical protein [unclassified Pseudomonas]MCU1737170.1 hypothetical protein [Pseudomonas sp. 20S_6.2_Bac1]